MLRTAIITSDRELATELNCALQSCREVGQIRALDYDSEDRQMTARIRTIAPRLVFLGIESPEKTIALASHLHAQFPGVAILAFGRQGRYDRIGEVMEAGIEQYLAQPFEPSCVRACVDSCLDNLEPRTEHVYAFLPSKAGVGASTLAVNVAVAMAAQCGPALLADLDLNCGMTRFLLNLNNPNSVVDAVGHALQMDDSRWRQMVTPRGKLDIIHAGPLDPDTRPGTGELQILLDYVRRKYQSVCVDLSSSLERVSLDVMGESKRVFLVCTPESSSLHLAKEKLLYLKRVGLGEKVQILLNRYSQNASMTPEDVEELVGAAVAGTFSSDYPRISQAMNGGVPMSPATETGRQCFALAQSLLAGGKPAPKTLKGSSCDSSAAERLEWDRLQFAPRQMSFSS
ncbi:MAG: hypothetical protein WKF37_07390 [Bryobacteraceae bacterium]